MVPASNPGGAIRGTKQGGNLFGIKESHRPFHLPLVRHSQNTLTMMEPSWLGHGDISEEGSDRGEPDISGSDAVASGRLNVAEEVGYHVGIDIRHIQFRGGFADAGPDMVSISRGAGYLYVAFECALIRVFILLNKRELLYVFHFLNGCAKPI